MAKVQKNNTVPKHFHDTTAMLRDAGQFNVKPNYTGKKKGGRSYVKSIRKPTFG